MNDLFALLGVAKRPWLEADLLKQRFLALSPESHPDRLHNEGEAEKRTAQERFTALNSAYQRLLDPRERLLHLIELDGGERVSEITAIPPDLMDLFLKVGKATRAADALLREKETESSPLLKVHLFERAQDSIEALRAVQREVNGSRERTLEEIRRLDADWESLATVEKTSRLRRLSEIAGLLNYSKKWNAQLEEKIVRLSF